jgi:hypothetical protein
MLIFNKEENPAIVNPKHVKSSRCNLVWHEGQSNALSDPKLSNGIREKKL